MPPMIAAALIVLFEGLSFAAVFPVISYYCQALGGDATWVGVLFALVALPKVVTNPLLGRLSDCWGRRPVLIVVTLGTAAGSIGWALAPSLLGLAAARLVTGMFSAQSVLAQAVAADVSPRAQRAAGMALLGAAFALALTLGPILGGLLARGGDYAAVGWACAAFQILSLGVILLFLRETRPAETVPPRGAGPLRPLLGRPVIRRLMTLTFVVTVAMSGLTSTLGLFTEKSYGFRAPQTALSFALLGFLATLSQGGGVRPLVARWGERAVAALGSVLLTVGFVLLALTPGLPLFFAALALFALGTGLVVPCLTALTSHAVGPTEQGAVIGLSQAFTGLGRGAGFLLGAWLFARGGAGWANLAAALFALLALALLFLPGTAAASVEPIRPEPQAP